jgi:hypothetical protein
MGDRHLVSGAEFQVESSERSLDSFTGIGNLRRGIPLLT